MELRGSYLEVKIHSPKNPIGEFVARGCRIWLTLISSNSDVIDFVTSLLLHMAQPMFSRRRPSWDN